MEMHQVRYFLATVSELNFTKAAERCNVTQPSLTRAIKQLEEELGGDLFRRERPQAQLTELGERARLGNDVAGREHGRGGDFVARHADRVERLEHRCVER